MMNKTADCPVTLVVYHYFVKGQAKEKRACKSFLKRRLGYRDVFSIRRSRQRQCGYGLLMRRKKSEIRVKRNLFEKVFAYQRSSAGIEHKSTILEEKEVFNVKNAAIKGNFDPK